MLTRCPACRTLFRVSSGQLRARSGRVRCGACRTVFDALDELLDDDEEASAVVARADGALPPPLAVAASMAPAAGRAESGTASAAQPSMAGARVAVATVAAPAAERRVEEPRGAEQEATTGEQGAAVIRRAPRSDWLGQPAVPVAAQAALRRFLLAACTVLALLLVGQLLFHWRGTLALRLPALRPALASLSAALGSDIPLPRHAQMVSIETSDLQIDGEPDRLLALQVTLRNRATYAQAYPALELTLTDTSDRVVARRVFLPPEYLPPGAFADTAPAPSFAGGGDVDLRLWIEARAIDAAGYRLYVFYP